MTRFRKELGRVYTPEALTLREIMNCFMAIDHLQAVTAIIDRCAGTGSREKGLTDEELSLHLSTVEYYGTGNAGNSGFKFVIISNLLESNNTFNAGLVRGADALSEGMSTIDYQAVSTTKIHDYPV